MTLTLVVPLLAASWCFSVFSAGLPKRERLDLHVKTDSSSPCLLLHPPVCVLSPPMPSWKRVTSAS